jgi:CubicO group peptidase (beta-lactamase class C family)
MMKSANPSRRRLHVVSALVASSLSACAPTTSGPDQVKDLNVTWIASSDEALDDASAPEANNIMNPFMAERGINGCALGLVVDGEVVHLKGYGQAGPGQPYDVNTMSPVGSVSKTLTALGVAALFSPNNFVCDDTPNTCIRANGLLPGNHAVGDHTLHELLTHQSGAGGPNQDAASEPTFLPGPHDPQGLAHPALAYDAYAAHTDDVDLGGGRVYSNVGYSILGAILDLMPGGYEQYIWSTVGRGSNLLVGSPTMALVHSWRETDIPNLAQGYDGNGNPVDPWDALGPTEGWEGPSGGWVMTIGDLARLTAAIQRREILDADDWENVIADHGDVLSEGYGYGMWVDPVMFYPGSKRLNHGGVIGGHIALWASYETPSELPFGVALQCNGFKDDGEDIKALKRATDELFRRHAQGGIPIVRRAPSTVSVGLAGVRGKTYPIDASQGSAHPFGVPESLLSSSLKLSVGTQTSGSTVSLTLSSVTAGAMPSTTWPGASFAGDPTVVTTNVRDVRLPTVAGLVKLERASLRATFARAGEAVESMKLSGFVDVRTIPTVWTLGRDACVEARLAGVPCGACADGAQKCVPVTITGWTAERTPVRTASHVP